MKNRSEAYPLREITFEEVNFKHTDLWKWGLWDVLDSINEGSNIWIDIDGKPMREWVGIYNKELLPWIFLIAFDTDEARTLQIEASKLLEWKETWKYTLPDITTFFEIEKDGKKLYCYIVDRLDMWKHKKDMLMWEIDNVSIDWMIVYPSGILQSGEQQQKTNSSVNNITIWDK